MIPGSHNLIKILFFLFFSLSINAEPIQGDNVIIKILDKITAKVEILNIKVNENIKFESLNIEVYACYLNPPEEVPEDLVLLKVIDEIDINKIIIIYQGWMISSSPATTPFEHPIYDLWVNECNVDSEL